MSSLNGEETLRLNTYLFTIYLQLPTRLNNVSSYITAPQTTVLHTELFPNYFCPNNYNTVWYSVLTEQQRNIDCILATEQQGNTSHSLLLIWGT